ncbi:PP2C family protein-serine/threonine phosphatase [Streptomyces sp. NPDC050560]|uniref:PP2C family protein-serine/threonine phosphatase n=1 Tax=Streptomyces sp. NPDC050560 TaxID=3365630 RepID=UPI0037B152D1
MGQAGPGGGEEPSDAPRDGHGGAVDERPAETDTATTRTTRTTLSTRQITALRIFVRAVPTVCIVAGVFYDLLLPPRFSALPMFAAAMLIAAPFYSFTGTALTALVTVLGVLSLHLKDDNVGKVDGVTDLITCAVIAMFALITNGVVRHGQELLASARGIAEAVQLALLPSPAHSIGGLDVAAHYEAAQADALIGGDLYAVQDTPHGVRLIVGDVRGKGTGAVGAVSIVIGAFREAAEHESTLEAVAQRLDRALAREAVRRGRGMEYSEGFATAVIAEIPYGHDVVRVVNRGHPLPLLLEPDGRLSEISGAPAALPLGMDLGAWPDHAQENEFHRGAMLLLFTDGLTEARDRHGVFYDPVQRLRGRVFQGPQALLATLTTEVRRHTGQRTTDDMALLAIRRPWRGP